MIENLEVGARGAGAGPVPTWDEIRAARDRHSLYPITATAQGHARDVHVASLLAGSLARLATAEPGEAAKDIAAMLATSVQVLADRHAGCTVLGCGRCLRLADAGAIAAAWRDGRG